MDNSTLGIIAAVLGIIAGILIFVLIISAIILSETTYNLCKQECRKVGTSTFDVKENGNWDMKDLCICYLNDGTIETKRLG